MSVGFGSQLSIPFGGATGADASTAIKGDTLIAENGVWTPDRLFQNIRGYRHNFGQGATFANASTIGAPVLTISQGNINASDNAATATEPSSVTNGTLATAELISRGLAESTGNAAQTTLGILLRFSCRQRVNNTTNVRYWIGLHAQDAAVNPTGNATYATDTPNENYVGFRFSSGLDTAWSAVAGTDNTHQTVLNTGVALDLVNTQLFEIVYDNVAGVVRFYINRQLVATIGTNIPALAQRLCWFSVADNKNTANAGTFTWAYTYILEK